MLKMGDAVGYGDRRVLVIEDELHIRQIIVRLLRQIGFRHVHEAADGEAGFRELIRTRPDVVLCDIHMKPMDGITFLRKLRALSKAEIAELPVVFLTADTQSDTVKTAVGLRVDGYLAKPVSLKSLKDRIDAVLPE